MVVGRRCKRIAGVDTGPLREAKGSERPRRLGPNFAVADICRGSSDSRIRLPVATRFYIFCIAFSQQSLAVRQALRHRPSCEGHLPKLPQSRLRSRRRSKPRQPEQTCHPTTIVDNLQLKGPECNSHVAYLLSMGLRVRLLRVSRRPGQQAR
jgi:hypothetical protein